MAREDLPTRDLLARVEAAQDEAQKRGPTDPASLELDREVVQLIRGARERDSILEALDLEGLAGTLERCVERLAEGGEPLDAGLRELTWHALDLLRCPAFLRRVGAAGATELWAQRILSAVEASHFTVGQLFRQRAATYATKVLFEVPTRGGGGESLTWSEVAARVETLARGLTALYHPEQPARIAILSENRIEMVLLDLACLTSGLENVMIPANATDADVGYILRHAKVGTVVVSGREQLDKVEKNRGSLPDLKHVITIDPLDGVAGTVTALREVETRASEVPASLIEQRSGAVRIGDRATVMYTSGTTGMPKGIQYSHRNLVFKRFARALALPEIGEGDVFLCYLPLFHTFGRYLEGRRHGLLPAHRFHQRSQEVDPALRSDRQAGRSSARAG
jgi:non-ribosomal peptide synthetase component F